MENRSLSLLAGLIAALLCGGGALAADSVGSAEQQAEWEQRLARAAELRTAGEAQRSAAAKRLEEKNAACQKRFRVNACLKTNEEEYSAAARLAKRQENDGLAIEREVRKEQLQAQDVLHDAKTAQRQAELPEREAETAAARQAVAERASERRAAQAEKAAAGLLRKEAEAEKLRRRQAEHAARVAEKMQKARPPAAASGAAAP